MLKKFLLKCFGVALAVLFASLCLNVNYVALFEIPNSIHITLDDLEDFNKYNCFGSFVNAEINQNVISVGGERVHNTKLSLKLFGLIPIREVVAVVDDEREVFLGGIPLGFSINSQGLIVVGNNSVNKESKSRNPFKAGDVITQINQTVIEEPSDISNLLNASNGNEIVVKLLRNNQEKEIVLIPEYDEVTNEYKLGLWVRDDAQALEH